MSARLSRRGQAGLALVVVDGVGLAAFRRVFDSWHALAEPAALLVGAHLTAALLRRRRVGPVVSAVVLAAAGAAVAGLAFYPHTTVAGLPWTGTLDQFGVDLRAAIEQASEAQAPVRAGPGFVAALGLVAWATGAVSDWFAFRFDGAAQATVPAGLLFTMAAVFGSPDLRITTTVAFALACATFLLLHRNARQQALWNWVRGHARDGGRAALTTGLAMAVVGVLVGVVLCRSVPGARSEAVLDWRDLGGALAGGRRVDPFADIRSQLVEQSDGELFTVRPISAEAQANPPRYWRLTALEDFDGERWRAASDPGRDDPFPPPAAAPSTAALEHEFSFERLVANVLPVPEGVQSVDLAGEGYSWDPATATLSASDKRRRGFHYRARSLPPAPAAPVAPPAPAVDLPPGVAMPLTVELPLLVTPPAGRFDGVSPLVLAKALEVTVSAASAYDQAAALETFFARGDFQYDLRPPDSGADDPLEAFVLVGRRGYCQQFAGAFAAMARAVGIPARVAIGFRTGEPEGDRWVVRGRDAHAWVEVHLGAPGWVAFDPTPAAAWSPASTEPTSGTSSLLLSSTDGSATALSGVLAPAAPSTTAPIALARRPDSDARGRSAGFTVLVAGVAGIVVLATAIVAVRMHRRRWRRQLESERQRVQRAWDTAVASVRRLGLVERYAETPMEYARRVQAEQNLPLDELHALAEMTTAARYGPPGTADEASSDQATALAERVATTVADALLASSTRSQRLGHRLSRSLR